MAQGTSWRTKFRRYLGERIGHAVSIGELVEQFGDEVPLHHASRIWLAHHRPAELSGAFRMRRYCITAELRNYPLLWQPRLGRRQPILDGYIVVPQGRLCRHCGKQYFAQLPVVSCGLRCAARARHAKAA